MLAKAPKFKDKETIAAEALAAEAAHEITVQAILNDEDTPPPACPWPRQPRIGARAGLGWYLLQAGSGAETRLTEFLKKFDYEVYYPKSLMMRLVPKRDLTKAQRAEGSIIRRPMLMPIFPTYPFIRFDVADPRGHEIFNFAGVYGLKCVGEQPIVIDDVFIARFKALESDGVIPASTAIKDLFTIGEKVRINQGSFRSFTAVVEKLPPKLQQQIDSGVISELDDSMCATVGLHIFGSVTRTAIPLQWLEKI